MPPIRARNTGDKNPLFLGIVAILVIFIVFQLLGGGGDKTAGLVMESATSSSSTTQITPVIPLAADEDRIQKLQESNNEFQNKSKGPSKGNNRRSSKWKKWHRQKNRSPKHKLPLHLQARKV